MTVVEALTPLTLRSNGSSVSDDVSARLVQVEVSLCVNAPATCDLEFADPSGAVAQTLRRGSSLSVCVGSSQRQVFEGSIVTVDVEARGDAVCTTRVSASDALHALRRGAAVRTFSNVTFAELARELTQPFGIAVAVTAGGPVFPRLVQHRRTDLDMLLTAAERAGTYVWLDGTTLRSCDPAPAAATKVLRLGDNVREARVSLSEDVAVRSVDVCGWDPHVASERHGRAMHEANVEGTVAITNVVVRSDREADAVARSQVQRRAASAAELYAIAEGDPELVPGTCVDVAGVPAGCEGPFRLTRTTHKLSPELGYVVELSSGIPVGHPPREGAIATLGIVSDARDPERLGRVKVRYPAVDGAESDWLQVLAAGAGGKKGLVAVPQQNDRVLVIGIGDDPAHGVVVGALYGEQGLPGDRVFSGYGLFSPGGHVIELDDAGSLTLRTPGGTSLELGKERTTLHSTTDLRIEAPGRTISLAANAVEFERA